MPNQVIIDANNILVRSSKAAERSSTQMSARGVYTGGLVIFANLISKYLVELAPERLVAVWDSGASEYRKALYDGYKANRGHPVSPGGNQGGNPSVNGDNPTFALAKEFLSLLGVHQAFIPGVEADDIISWYARHNKTRLQTYIVSGDKDFLQLITPSVRVYVPNGNIWGPSTFREVYKVPPADFAIILAICGDAVDGIPGVPRFGIKTAIRVYNKYQRDLERAMTEDLRLMIHRKLIERNLALVDLTKDIMTLDLGYIPPYKPIGKDDIGWPLLMDFLDKYKLAQLKTRFTGGNFGKKSNLPKRQLFEQLSLMDSVG